MKKVLLLAVAMVMAVSANAQHSVGSISLIPKVGINLANLAGDINDNSMKVGLVAGADIMYQVTDMIGLSGGLYYSMQGCEFSGDSKQSIGELNIPLLANFYVAPNFALKVGLQPGLIVSAEAKSGKTTTDIKDNLQTLELSIPIGASYEYSDFVFDARYNLGLSKTNKGNGSVRNSVFQITVGYKFDL
ncbi:MAG: PorT family protein [Prevotella sp.]|nr:PorT family protein [Prevotella sp.]